MKVKLTLFVAIPNSIIYWLLNRQMLIAANIRSFVSINCTTMIIMTNATIERKTYTLGEVDTLDECFRLTQLLDKCWSIRTFCTKLVATIDLVSRCLGQLANEQKFSNNTK